MKSPSWIWLLLVNGLRQRGLVRKDGRADGARDNTRSASAHVCHVPSLESGETPIIDSQDRRAALLSSKVRCLSLHSHPPRSQRTIATPVASHWFITVRTRWLTNPDHLAPRHNVTLIQECVYNPAKRCELHQHSLLQCQTSTWLFLSARLSAG